MIKNIFSLSRSKIPINTENTILYYRYLEIVIKCNLQQPFKHQQKLTFASWDFNKKDIIFSLEIHNLFQDI